MMDSMKQRMWTQLLSTNGDGTGTVDFNGNYAVTAATGLLRAPNAGDTFHVARLIVFLQDGTGMKAEEYGDLGAALTNGITMVLESDGDTTPIEIVDFCAGIPLKTNADWGVLCYDVDMKTWGGAAPGDDILLARFTFSKFTKNGDSIALTGDDQIRMVFNDNLSTLVHHRFLFEGELT